MPRTPEPPAPCSLARAHPPAGSQRFDNRAILLPGRHRQVEVPLLETAIPACRRCGAAPSITFPVVLSTGHGSPPPAWSHGVAANRGRPAQRCPPPYPHRGPAPGLPDHPHCRGGQYQLGRHAMISLPSSVRVFLHAPPTDLRKGFDALSGLVTTAFGQDPTSGHLFLFVNRRRDRIKILYWDPATAWRSGTSGSESGTFQIPDGSPRCGVDRDDSDPVVADPLRHRPAVRTATQTLSAAHDGRPKNRSVSPCNIVSDHAIIRLMNTPAVMAH